MDLRISDDVRRNRSGQPGGDAWLAGLAGTVARFVERWQLTDARQDLPSEWNLVLRAVRGPERRPVVAKFSLPDFENIAATVALDFDADGLVRLLDYDLDAGVQLLAWEDAVPLAASEGDRQSGVRVGRAVSRLSGIGMRPGMIPLARWCKDLLEPPFRHPDWDLLVEHNRTRCLRLLESSSTDQWVHGDLHHGNLLVRADGSDVVIDPKGVCGDPAFDACTFVRNQIDLDLPEVELRSRFAERLIGFGEGSGLPLGRCVAWAAAGNTLSEIWDAEGVRGDGFARRLHYVRILSEMADGMGE